MAIRATFYETLNFALMTGSGRIIAKDFKDYILDFVCKDPRIKNGFIELADMREVEGNDITLQDMLDIVRLEQTSRRPQPSKLAFVVRDDSSYGAVRQYAAHVCVEGKETRVFYDINEAKLWLGIEGFELK
jgi:hypothetical protein